MNATMIVNKRVESWKLLFQWNLYNYHQNSMIHTAAHHHTLHRIFFYFFIFSFFNKLCYILIVGNFVLFSFVSNGHNGSSSNDQVELNGSRTKEFLHSFPSISSESFKVLERIFSFFYYIDFQWGEVNYFIWMEVHFMHVLNMLNFLFWSSNDKIFSHRIQIVFLFQRNSKIYWDFLFFLLKINKKIWS